MGFRQRDSKIDMSQTDITCCPKGIILAGGAGTRLSPITIGCSKQLLPVYDKPMIYYPLSTLLLAGIRNILLVTTPKDVSAFQSLLGDGGRFGITIHYAAQPRPEGIAQAFVIGRSFVANDRVALILGDNIFYGQGLQHLLAKASYRQTGATVFAYAVKDPERYGVVEFDAHGRAKSLVEKPVSPKSRYAVPGLYFYDNQILDVAANLKASARGELEITDANLWYLQHSQLYVETFGRGFAWLDTGTAASLLQAANFVEALEQRQGLRICCPEEIALRSGFITPDQLAKSAGGMKSDYGRYLSELIDHVSAGGELVPEL
jgi:glucose-1-phosphate thymidylyltransferase